MRWFYVSVPASGWGLWSVGADDFSLLPDMPLVTLRDDPRSLHALEVGVRAAEWDGPHAGVLAKLMGDRLRRAAREASRRAAIHTRSR